MKKLLIAEKSEALTAALLRCIGDQFEVYTCSHGDAAIQLLDAVRPDILFLDLTLHMVDGFSVLQNASFLPPVCIARTSLVTEELLRATENAGIQHLFRIPCAVRLITDCLKQYR